MRFNVPRMGAAGGFVHQHGGFLCNESTPNLQSHPVDIIGMQKAIEERDNLQMALKEQIKFLGLLDDDLNLLHVGNLPHKKANIQSSMRGLKMLAEAALKK